MSLRYCIIGLCSFLGLCFAHFECQAQEESFNQRHIELAMRMIGHQTLLQACDSTSLVLPIERDGNQFRVQFDTEFALQPEELVRTVKKVMVKSNIADQFILEVLSCETGLVVYAFQVNGPTPTGEISCLQRDLPKACYTFLITLPERPVELKQTQYYVSATIIGLFLVGFLMLRTKTQKPQTETELLQLGQFQYDPIQSLLLIGDQKIELSGKENDLLKLLHQNVNTTVEREVILNKVWGDEGNYVGRTLDVYISKLRKRLEADPKVKIVNTRGVGYRLMVTEPSA